MIVTLTIEQQRTLTAESFADITTAQVVEMGHTVQGEPYVEFASDLTQDQIDAVRRRLRAGTANEETMHSRAAAALADLRTLRDTTGTLTGAQLSSAARLLARVCIGLIRLRLRALEGTD